MRNRAELLTKFNASNAASEELIAKAEGQLGITLPSDYVRFLKVMNGGEGFIGNASYAIFWRVDELFQVNLDYEIELMTPGFLAFGSNGGGEAFGFDTRSRNWPVVQMPFIGMDWKEASTVGSSFDEMLNYLSNLD